MAHDGAGQCTSDCRRIGCPEDDEPEELLSEAQQLNQEHTNNCSGCALCED